MEHFLSWNCLYCKKGIIYAKRACLEENGTSWDYWNWFLARMILMDTVDKCSYTRVSFRTYWLVQFSLYKFRDSVSLLALFFVIRVWRRGYVWAYGFGYTLVCLYLLGDILRVYVYFTCLRYVYTWRPTGPLLLVSNLMCYTLIRVWLRRIILLTVHLEISFKECLANIPLDGVAVWVVKVQWLYWPYVFILLELLCYCVSGFGDLH